MEYLTGQWITSMAKNKARNTVKVINPPKKVEPRVRDLAYGQMFRYLDGGEENVYMLVNPGITGDNEAVFLPTGQLYRDLNPEALIVIVRDIRLGD
jgi:hypothetical protein